MGKLVYNFSILLSFINLQEIFSGLGLWTLYIASSAIRASYQQLVRKCVVCQVHGSEQMLPQHFPVTLVPMMEKMRNQRKKIGVTFCDKKIAFEQ